jgi:hypothetical protein
MTLSRELLFLKRLDFNYVVFWVILFMEKSNTYVKFRNLNCRLQMHMYILVPTWPDLIPNTCHTPAGFVRRCQMNSIFLDTLTLGNLDFHYIHTVARVNSLVVEIYAQNLGFIFLPTFAWLTDKRGQCYNHFFQRFSAKKMRVFLKNLIKIMAVF